MDGQLQERWVRERRALGSKLCACSAPKGAPQAERGEANQGRGARNSPACPGRTWLVAAGWAQGSGCSQTWAHQLCHPDAPSPNPAPSGSSQQLTPTCRTSVQSQLSPGTSGSSSGGPWPGCPHPSLLAVPRAPATDFLASLALTAAKKVPCEPAICHPSAACEAWRQLRRVAGSSELTPPARPAPSRVAWSPLLPGLPARHPQSYKGKDPCSPTVRRGGG